MSWRLPRVKIGDNLKHPDDPNPTWLGDSIGHWEGNTLVVETTNFNDKVNFQGASQNMKVTERFTRTDAQITISEY